VTDAWLQVASLNREVVALRESVQAKDAELASATAAGSSELEDLRSARQELADNMAAAQEQLQVISTHKSKRHLLGFRQTLWVLAADWIVHFNHCSLCFNWTLACLQSLLSLGCANYSPFSKLPSLLSTWYTS